MSFNYTKSHLKDLKAKIEKRGNTIEDVLTLAVFYDLTLTQVHELAELCGLELSVNQVAEYRERLEAYGASEIALDAVVERFAEPATPALSTESMLRIRTFGRGGKLQ